MLAEAVKAPLVAMLQEYNAAIAAMAQIVEALRPLTLALGMPAALPEAPFPSVPLPETQPPGSAPRATAPTATSPARPHRSNTEVLELEVTAPNEVAILEFEEQISEIPGVMRVSLKSYAQGKATLAVELQPVVRPSDGDSAVSVVCAWCGKVLTVGDSRISHGLCPECAAKVEASAGRKMEPDAVAAPVRRGRDGIVYLTRSNGHWFESRVGASGEFEDAPTGFPALTSAQQVLKRIQAKYPDRLVVISGDNVAQTPPATLAATPV